jgi:hypothetical protein
VEVSGQLHITAALTSGKERSPCTGGWVGPRAVLDTVAKRKIPSPLLGLEPPIIQSIAQFYITKLSRLL